MGHAILSPSAAHRWMNCPLAPWLESEVEDIGSEFAREGSLAHAFAAKKLKHYLGIPTTKEDIEIDALKEYASGEMNEYTDSYATDVVERFLSTKHLTPDAKLMVETRLDFGTYIPEAYGTADATIIADGVLDIIDFKYGKGVKVSAWYNEQMMIYGLGSYLAHSDEYRIETIRMTIIQPRIDNISEFEMSVEGLLDWADNELKPKARMAYKQMGEAKPGAWCQFCKLNTTCKALSEKCMGTFRKYSDIMTVTPDAMGSEILPWISLIKSWATKIEEHALAWALSGNKIPGYKIVEGRAVRKVTNPEGMIEALTNDGYDCEDFLKPPTLVAIGDLEKLVGKKKLGELAGHCITRPKGKPTLVTIDDKRPEWNQAGEDFDELFDK